MVQRAARRNLLPLFSVSSLLAGEILNHHALTVSWRSNRDQANLDLFSPRDESLEESDNLQLSGSMFNVQSSMRRGEEIVEDLEPPPSNNSARSQMT
jgi:hypothetical protein